MKNLKIFKNSKVIVTGHTGFKGSWLTAWLKKLGANVMGISLNPPTNPSHFQAAKIAKMQGRVPGKQQKVDEKQQKVAEKHKVPHK